MNPVHVDKRLARVDNLVARYSKQITKALLNDLEAAVAAYEATGSDLLAVGLIGSKALKVVLDQLWLDIVPAEAKHEYLHLVGEKKATPTLPVAEWLRRARNFIATESSKAITSITNTTRKKVRKVLKASAEAGSSIPNTAKSLRQRITIFSKKRAELIARTELIGAMNYGSFCGADTSGLQLDKVWLATSDTRTRPTHSATNGIAVDINGLFTVGGSPCRFPADPALPARERCRCRCTTIYQRKKPQEGTQLSLGF
ncbi:phage minor head protein [Hymenobacter sublimis]|uniref:Phage head morphogenesis protein n=1 Tax=Hymenobacter sublimis TaxID=2933777 RepID=A0ABY4JF18_9BACT|nr:phage minor head protein [Hymenobacter sublimis]UPL50553.1 phage head morphogenesis protein [Hymenobacter sublimis]